MADKHIVLRTAIHRVQKNFRKQEVEALKVLKHNVELDSSLRDSSSAEGSESDDNCVGQCAFQFVDQLKMELGDRSVLGLLDLNFNEFLIAFSNITFFEAFCKWIGHLVMHRNNFQLANVLNTAGIITISSTVTVASSVSHQCLFAAIHERFGCLSKLDSDVSKQCLNICVPHHKAVNSIMNNFKYLALNGDSSSAEKYLNESCEYVICALHCDVPAIAHHCGHETSNLVIDLTRKSFNSMQSMALGTGAISSGFTSYTSGGQLRVRRFKPIRYRNDLLLRHLKAKPFRRRNLSQQEQKRFQWFPLLEVHLLMSIV
ncbi:unnamed protein product [Anisakis simplex]|uniref:DmX-like protein 2 n=1 Tax=Anisakis simplex TaxID=6269 RepID=A0A0M3K5G2_ANISI|nr:unnamed protein product [Anisakis simplex]